MKNLNIKYFLYIILGISAILWFVIATVLGKDLSKLWDLLRILPTVAMIDLLIFLGFAKWAWRWKIFQGWLVPFPDLSGTWQGQIQTSWKNPETGEVPGPIPAILTIKQSFGKISCVMRTSEMVSYSYSEEFKIETDNQIKQLTYSYSSKPKYALTDRSIPHDGTIIFDILGTPVSKLQGQYWTSRKSTGEVTLTYREKKHLDEMPDDLNGHPVSDPSN